MPERVGIIGLGIMGRAYAANLLAAGFAVSGFDIDPTAADWLRSQGGSPSESAAELARTAAVIIVAVATPAALAAVLGKNGVAAGCNSRTVVVEAGTFPTEVKEACAAPLRAAGATVLDCPVSGTGAQARSRDLIVYASGDEVQVERCRPVFDGFAAKTIYVGAFGAGMKMKCIANHLVTIHNLAAAEALRLAARAGLDRQRVYEAICGGAGSSRMFEVRGPMMVAEVYEPPTMKFDVYIKDIDLIRAFARQAMAPTPLLDACVSYYYAALAQGRDKQDTAGLYGVLKDLAGDNEAESGST